MMIVTIWLFRYFGGALRGSCRTSLREDMGISKNQGPNSRALIVRTSARRTPKLWKQRYMNRCMHINAYTGLHKGPW